MTYTNFIASWNKLLVFIRDKANEQYRIETTMDKWKGDSKQVDDILVMGVRF